MHIQIVSYWLMWWNLLLRAENRRKLLLVSMRERPSGPLADPPSSLFLWGACLLLTATDQIWLTKINGRALTSDRFNLATVLARNKRAHCQQGSAHFNAYSIPFTHILSLIYQNIYGIQLLEGWLLLLFFFSFGQFLSVFDLTGPLTRL